jgi:hypothetical protein
VLFLSGLELHEARCDLFPVNSSRSFTRKRSGDATCSQAERSRSLSSLVGRRRTFISPLHQLVDHIVLHC